jgi:hypothetical protein
MSKPRLVVHVEGGLVQDIWSDVPCDVLILDCDTDGMDRLKAIRDWDFKAHAPSEQTFEAFDTQPWDPFVEPAAVDHFFNEMAKESEGSEDADEVVSEVQEAAGEGK